jgi:hypothetical protein
MLLKEESSRGMFLERRRLRRFDLDQPVELVQKHRLSMAWAVNISLSGILCRCKERFPAGSQIAVRLSLKRLIGERLLLRGGNKEGLPA